MSKEKSIVKFVELSADRKFRAARRETVRPDFRISLQRGQAAGTGGWFVAHDAPRRVSKERGAQS